MVRDHGKLHQPPARRQLHEFRLLHTGKLSLASAGNTMLDGKPWCYILCVQTGLR